MRATLSAFLICLLAAPSIRADEPQVRTWTDETGRFKIEATLEPVVILKRADGTVSQIPLQRLSRLDQMLVLEELRKAIDGQIETPEQKAEEIAKQLTESLGDGERKRIAILDLRRFDGTPHPLSLRVTEPLTTYLVKTERCDVYERLQLDKIMQEQKLGQGGFVDPASAKKIGLLTGVTDVLTGTMDDEGRINARLISTQTGMITAVGDAGLSPTYPMAQRLANKLSEQLERKDELKSVAVIGLVSLDAKGNEFAEALNEDLTTAFVRAGTVTVAERQLLEQVLREHKLNDSGLIAESTAQTLGKLLAVDGVVIGSIRLDGAQLRADARVIKVENGIAVAAEEESTTLPSLSDGLVAKKTTKDNATLVKGDFLREDFKGIKEGNIPENWTGPSVQVKSIKGVKLLTNIANAEDHQVTIESLELPENFSLTWKLVTGPHNYPHQINYDVRVGDVLVRLHAGDAKAVLYLNKVEQKISFDEVNNKIVKLSLEKKDDVFRVLINDRQEILARLEGFKTPTGITIHAKNEYGERFKWDFGLMSIEGKAIEADD